MTITAPELPADESPSAATRTDPGPRGRRLAYEPALDGLRGAAVVAVVLYHGGVGWATGGYLGVDAFFVLSGFLITSLLVREWQAEGRIALGDFWVHRIRRLLPALLVMLAGVGVLGRLLDRSNLDQLRGDGIATVGYLMNWRLVTSSESYFDQFFVSPLRHGWSLAIEEQYYLVWPIVVVLVLRRGSLLRLLGVCLALAVGSAALMAALYDPASDPSRLYYGTDTRAQALLIGSALAVAVAAGLRIPAKDHKPLLRTTAVGLVVLGLAWTGLPGTHALLYRGGFFLFAVLVALVILACTQLGDNRIRHGLSWRPLRSVGLISYGLYLYHFPIFIWLNSERTGLEAGSARLLVLRLAVTTVAATASYVLLERPVRAGLVGRLPVSRPVRWLVGPAATAVVLLLLLTTTARASGTSAGAQATIAPPLPTAAATRVLLVGDSVAYTLGVGFEGEVSGRDNLAMWNQAVMFCELTGAPRRDGDVVSAPSDTCADWQATWRRNVEEFDPQVTVVSIGAWEIFDRQFAGAWVEFGSREFDLVLTGILDRVIDVLGSRGAPVVLLTTPRFERDDGLSTQLWTQNDTARTDHFNELLRQAAARHPGRVVLLDLAEHLCPGNECRDTIDGVTMRPDGVHFGAEDAQVVARWLAPQLTRIAGERTATPAETASPAPDTTSAPDTTAAPVSTSPPASMVVPELTAEPGPDGRR